jgi:L-asparaginase/Glu-tRNA(Gln) amidotransferase subunit D
LVIATGGTFACVNTPTGYAPEKGIIKRLRLFKSLYDKEYSDSHNVGDDECITPITPFKKRIFYKVFEFEEFLDSSNMDMNDQLSIAQCVKDHYADFDGFVVLHGTDTMAYTSSTLSFVLENLNKPVIITGS